jgi:hypothetical protein
VGHAGSVSVIALKVAAVMAMRGLI